MARVDEAEAIRLYVDEGLSLAECGRRLGVTNTGIRMALARNGITRRSKTEHLSRIDVAEAIRLYVDEGLSLDECGRRMGVTGTGVKVALARHGIPTRSLSEQSTRIDRAEAVRLYVDERLSLVECGERMGFSWTGVRAALIRAGVNPSERLGSGRRGKSKGRMKTSQGYILVYAPDHPAAKQGRYVFEHRLVMEQHIGRYLDGSEVVHHINGCRSDNRIENLQLFASNGEHLRHTLGQRWSRKYDRCQQCGTTDRRHDARGLCSLCYQRSNRDG